MHSPRDFCTFPLAFDNRLNMVPYEKECDDSSGTLIEQKMLTSYDLALVDYMTAGASFRFAFPEKSKRHAHC